MRLPRTIGLALICLGVLVLLGNTMEVLPPAAFFAGLALYPIGGYLFFIGSRQAINEAEERASRIIRPKLKNETAERFAKAQEKNIDTYGSVDDQVRGLRSEESMDTEGLNDAEGSLAGDDLLMDIDQDLSDSSHDELDVSTDVSFPIEIQAQDSLADQIMKLQKLQVNGVISAEEMAIAKAKLLS
jgi:hypothetical protein